MPKKWGIKVFTHAGVSGLVYDFQVYTGKGTVPNERGLFNGPDPVDRCRRWSKEKKEYVEVDRRHIVKVYNNNMGGVDLADMFAALYRIELRPRRWYLRILYYLIDLSLVNGWLLYRRHLTQKQEKKYMPLLDFRAQVAVALIKVGKRANLNSRKRGRPSSEEAPERSQAATSSSPGQRIIAPSVGIRLDRFDHFPIHADKRG